MKILWCCSTLYQGASPFRSGLMNFDAACIKMPTKPHAELAFVVDEEFQNHGISSYLLKLITRIAKKKGVKTFTFEVLFSNTAMMRVFKKTFNKVEATLEEGIYSVSIPLD